MPPLYGEEDCKGTAKLSDVEQDRSLEGEGIFIGVLSVYHGVSVPVVRPAISGSDDDPNQAARSPGFSGSSTAFSLNNSQPSIMLVDDHLNVEWSGR